MPKTYTKASKEELSNRIGTITQKSHFMQLFKLINDNGVSYTRAPGKGIYIDLNKCNDDLLKKIEKFLDKHYPKIINRPLSEGFETYYSEESDMSSLKLTNQEKNILRQTEKSESYLSSASERPSKKKVIVRQFS